MFVELEVSHPNGGTQLVRLKSDTLIGRSDDCNLRIRSKQVSRKHCRIELTAAGVCVRDLNSSNGTFVNGDRIPADNSVSLSPGCRLMVGAVTFKVRFEVPKGSSEPDYLGEDTLPLSDRLESIGIPPAPETELEVPVAEPPAAAPPSSAELADTVVPDTVVPDTVVPDTTRPTVVPMHQAADAEQAGDAKSLAEASDTETAEVDDPIEDESDPAETLADERDLTWRQSSDETIRTLSLSEDEDAFEAFHEKRPTLDETLPEDEFPSLFETMAEDSEWEPPEDEPSGDGNRQQSEPSADPPSSAEPSQTESLSGVLKPADDPETAEDK